MVKLSLKGQFKFNGNGNFSEERRKIKVLKQLGNDLFICGDRVKPELIYTISADKQIVYARIDNQGDGLDDWGVALMLKPFAFEYDPLIDYNQQNNRDGTEEVVYLSLSGVVETISLNSDSFINNTKIYHGNHSLCQLKLDGSNVILKTNNEIEEVFGDGDAKSYQADLFTYSNLGNILSALSKSVESDSEAKKRFFYKSPYHKIKPLYLSSDKPINERPLNSPAPFRAIFAQTYSVKTSTKYRTETFTEPGSDGSDDREGNRDTDGTMNFADKCGKPGDAIAFFLVKDIGWLGGSGISTSRTFPNICQGKPPPYPTFKASCSVIREAEQYEKWCPTFIGSGYYASHILGGFSYSSSPPFGGRILDSSNGRISGVRAIFEPNPKDLSEGKLEEVGDTLTSVAGRGDLRFVGIPRMITLNDDAPPEAQAWIAEFNGLRMEMFNEAVARLSNPVDGSLLDMGLFSPEGTRINRCEYPYPEDDSGGGNNRGDGDGGGPQFKRSDTNKFEIEEFFISKHIIGQFFPFKWLVIRLTNDNYEDINTEMFDLFNKEHGLSVNPVSGKVYSIDDKQTSINQDKLTLKNNESTWDVFDYQFNYIDSSTNISPSTDCGYSKQTIKEKVLPLKGFDKIWSYSYYA